MIRRLVSISKEQFTQQIAKKLSASQKDRVEGLAKAFWQLGIPERAFLQKKIEKLVEANELFGYISPNPKLDSLLAEKDLSAPSEQRARALEEMQARIEGSDIMKMFSSAPAAASAPVEAAPVEEKPVEVAKKKFDVVLVGIDASKKLNIIKELRAIFTIGLKEAKDMVEKPPVVLKKDVPVEDLEALQKRLTDLGCTVEAK